MESSPNKSANKKLLIGCGIALAGILLLCILAIGGGMIWLVTGPEGGVRLSNEMEQYALDYIAEQDLLNETENIIAYYDVTLSLNSSEAAILTTERLIYHKDGRTTAIGLQDIEDIQHRYDVFGLKHQTNRH